MTLGTVKAPTPAQLAELADELGFAMSDEELAAHLEAMRPNIEAYNAVDRMPQPAAGEVPAHAGLPAERRGEPATTPGTSRPTIEGAPYGKLKGKRVVLKDNICLAGVPMMNGASTLEGYVPDVDATIVTRILDAGGTIVGKAHCEYFCFSGGSHTSAPGPVHNPHKLGYSAGGSSSGSAALVARRRGRHGDRRRPGRLDPHAGGVLRHLRHEADARPRALHRHHADRADASTTPGR